jgi:CheY-like chemotaxis protein
VFAIEKSLAVSGQKKNGARPKGRTGVGLYAFVEAADADSAVPILDSAQRIDLMISDVGLPGMNGRQLAEIGRQYRPELKVLFITGYAEHAAVRGGFLDPGMQMITKPFTFDLLTAKVREMIRS